MGISYRVAWYMLHRFRVAMVRPSREPLSGEVEVDETLVESVDEGGKRGRGMSKEIIVMALEIKHPKGFGRIRMEFRKEVIELIGFIELVFEGKEGILNRGHQRWKEKKCVSIVYQLVNACRELQKYNYC